jgi:hypothetical protein
LKIEELTAKYGGSATGEQYTNPESLRGKRMFRQNQPNPSNEALRTLRPLREESAQQEFKRDSTSREPFQRFNFSKHQLRAANCPTQNARGQFPAKTSRQTSQIKGISASIHPICPFASKKTHGASFNTCLPTILSCSSQATAEASERRRDATLTTHHASVSTFLPRRSQVKTSQRFNDSTTKV